MAEELDLTTEPVDADLLRSETTPYDPAPERERLRGVIATLLVGMLVGIVLLTLASLWFNSEGFDQLKGVLDLILSAVVGLGGAVTGVYFGERSRAQR